MCGIAGIVGIEPSEKWNDSIRRMIKIISHRGPDGYGFYSEQNLLFGHCRLSILDLSDLGKQPMEYMNRYVITYNGEIYNYVELKSFLIQKGYCFRSETDTEVIMAAYDLWGESCLEHFNGMWAFAIFDKHCQTVFCARDRFGVKPLYYFQMGGVLAFSSEIKQFTVLDSWIASANIQKILDFLTTGMIDHTHETVFKNVYQLRGGDSLLYKLDTKDYEIRHWYDLKSRIKEEINYVKGEYYQLFSDSVRLRLRSDVKVGSCLSGGMDSSTIVCMTSKLLNHISNDCKHETVSSCFSDKKYDEQKYIDKVINKTQAISHKVFPKFEDLFDKLDLITWHQDEPFCSTSVFAQWNVFKTARENNILVMLDGQGADEQLAGYDKFFMSYYLELFHLGKWRKLNSEISNYEKLYSKRIKKVFLNTLVKSMLNKLLPDFLCRRYRVKRVQHAYKWLKITPGENYLGYNISIKSESIKELLHTSLPMLLHYEDRNSMANSVESRVPFVDYRLVEYSLQLRSCCKIKDAITKKILRDEMIDILPKEIVERYDKLGFVTPEEIWVRENRQLFREKLCETCDMIPSIVDKEGVLKWFDETLNSSRNFDYMFWKLISLGRWIKVFNVKV